MSSKTIKPDTTKEEKIDKFFESNENREFKVPFPASTDNDIEQYINYLKNKFENEDPDITKILKLKNDIYSYYNSLNEKLKISSINPEKGIYNFKKDKTINDLLPTVKKMLYGKPFEKFKKEALILIGSPGSGKSTVLQKMFIDSIQFWKRGDPVPIYINLKIDQNLKLLWENLTCFLGLKEVEFNNLIESPLSLFLDSLDESRLDLIGIKNIFKSLFTSPVLNSVKMIIACRSGFLNEENYGEILEDNIKVNFSYIVPLDYFFFGDSTNLDHLITLYIKKWAKNQNDDDMNTSRYLRQNIEKYELKKVMKTYQIIFSVFQTLMKLKEIDPFSQNINLLKFYEMYLQINIENEIFRSENPSMKQKAVQWFMKIGVLLAENMMMNEQSLNELRGEEVFRLLSNHLITEIGEENNLNMPFKENHNMCICDILKFLNINICFEYGLLNRIKSISFRDENIKYCYLIRGLIDRFLSFNEFPQWLSQRNFNEDKKLAIWMLEAFRNTSKLIDAAEKAIFATRKSEDSKIIMRAANLITFLVSSNHSFYGRDLSHIKIKGANLSDGMFNACNFDNADLSQVTLNNAKLDGVSFFNTKLNNAEVDCYLNLQQQSGWVTSAVFSPNGLYIASGSNDKTVRIWDVTTGKEIKKFEGHELAVHSIAYSYDGLFIASTSWDKIVIIWDAMSTKEVKNFEIDNESYDENECAFLYEYSVSFSPNGILVVFGNSDGTIIIWDFMFSKEIKKLKGHDHSVNSVAFSPNGLLIVTGSYDDTVRIWDVISGKEIKKFERHENMGYKSVAFYPNGLQILIDQSVIIWDIISGEEVKKFDGKFSSAAFSPDGDKIVCGSNNGTVILFDIKSGTKIKTFEGHCNNVVSVAFSPDGEKILSESDDGIVRIWQLMPEKVIKKFEGHQSRVYSVAFSRSGDKIVSNDEFTVRIWDVASGNETILFENSEMKGAVLSPNEDIILLNIEGSCSLRNVISGKKIINFIDRLNAYSFSPNGDKIVTANKTIQIWSVISGKNIMHFKGNSNHFINSIVFSPKGDKIVSGSTDKNIIVWNARSGKKIKLFQGHSESVIFVTFSPNGRFIASGSSDGTVRIWDLMIGKEINKFIHNDWVLAIAFFPNGNKIVSGSRDKTVQIWDLMSGKEIKRFLGHDDRVISVAVSPIGDKIASGSYDKTVRIWDVRSLNEDNILNEEKQTRIKHDRMMVSLERSNTCLIKASYSTFFSCKNCLGYEELLGCPELLLSLFRQNDFSLKTDK